MQNSFVISPENTTYQPSVYQQEVQDQKLTNPPVRTFTGCLLLYYRCILFLICMLIFNESVLEVLYVISLKGVKAHFFSLYNYF